MKNLLKMPWSRRWFPLAVLAAAWIGSTGCEFLRNEDEGDGDPKGKTKRFLLTAAPQTIFLSSTHDSHVVTLSARCVCDDPKECGGSISGWAARGDNTYKVVNVSATPPDAEGNARATISVDWFGLPRNPSKAGRLQTYVLFDPVGIDADALGGTRRIDVVIDLEPAGEGSRQETPPTAKSLRTWPSSKLIEPNTTVDIGLIYKGPPTTLVEAVTVGPHTSEFQLSGPNLPLPLKEYTAVVFAVRFTGKPGNTCEVRFRTVDGLVAHANLNH